MKSIIIMDATLCSPVEVHRRFERKYCFHFQGLRDIHESNQQEAGGKQSYLTPVSC
jgi:hypothetical protein